MSQNQTPNQLPRGKPTEAWRVERMVQRVPGHLGEESRFSPWLVVAAVAVVVLVGALLLFFTQWPDSSGAAATSMTATPRARAPITRIVTATPGNTQTASPQPTAAIIQYTVKQGDTLSTIARQFKISVESIRAANKLSSDTIHAGDVLKIPLPPPAPTPGAVSEAVGGPTNATTAATNTPLVFRTPTLIAFLSPTPGKPTTPTATPGVVPYMVRTGDTLISIASVFSTTVQSIMTINNMSGPDLRAGQMITVPVGAWVPTATPTISVPPTVTPTPQFTYDAPDLLYPSEGADFAHNTTITLQWLSPGVLAADEYYVVHLRYLANGVEENLPGYAVSEGTVLTLETSPASDGGPTEFWWYVVVVRGSGCGAASPAAVQPCAVSPVSETRSFTWR